MRNRKNGMNKAGLTPAFSLPMPVDVILNSKPHKVKNTHTKPRGQPRQIMICYSADLSTYKLSLMVAMIVMHDGPPIGS